MLAWILRSHPQQALEQADGLRALLVLFRTEQHSTGAALLSALLPVLKLLPALRSALIAALRRASFSPLLPSAAAATQTAATGFVLLLSHSRPAGHAEGVFTDRQAVQTGRSQCSTSSQSQSSLSLSLSQASGSSAGRSVPVGPSQLQPPSQENLDLLFSLRRCLKQQSEVRLRVYEGLLEVAATSRDGSLASSALLLLSQHFELFCELHSSSLPPLRIAQAVLVKKGALLIREPLDRLFLHVVLLLRRCHQLLQVRFSLLLLLYVKEFHTPKKLKVPFIS